MTSNLYRSLQTWRRQNTRKQSYTPSRPQSAVALIYPALALLGAGIAGLSYADDIFDLNH